MTTDRNLTQELLYSYYEDRENGNDEETIDYRSLIHLLGELLDRIEKLEKRLDQQDEYQQEQNEI
jgi:hypothetical protein